jgi:hypothetical protein
VADRLTMGDYIKTGSPFVGAPGVLMRRMGPAVLGG